jgi:hypothetical protein
MATYNAQEIRFTNDAWVGATWGYQIVKYQDHQCGYDGCCYYGQSKTYNLVGSIPLDAGNQIKPTYSTGFHFDDAFGDTIVIDPTSNKRVKYSITGTEFSITPHFDGIEDISSPVPAGQGILTISCSAPVSTEKGYLEQIIVNENGTIKFSKTYDTSNASEVFRIGLVNSKTYDITLIQKYNLAMPYEIPAWVTATHKVTLSNAVEPGNDMNLIIEGDNQSIGTQLWYSVSYAGKNWHLKDNATID